MFPSKSLFWPYRPLLWPSQSIENWILRLSVLFPYFLSQWKWCFLPNRSLAKRAKNQTDNGVRVESIPCAIFQDFCIDWAHFAGPGVVEPFCWGLRETWGSLCASSPIVSRQEMSHDRWGCSPWSPCSHRHRPRSWDRTRSWQGQIGCRRRLIHQELFFLVLVLSNQCQDRTLSRALGQCGVISCCTVLHDVPKISC